MPQRTFSDGKGEVPLEKIVMTERTFRLTG